MALESVYRRPGVLDRQSLTRHEPGGVFDHEERILDDVRQVDQVAVGLDAELADVGLRGGDDHQFFDPPLEQAAGIDAVPEAGEGAQDLRPEAHRLDHLDGRVAALPQASTLVERRIVLDGLERGPDLRRRDGDAHQTVSSASARHL